MWSADQAIWFLQTGEEADLQKLDNAGAVAIEIRKSMRTLPPIRSKAEAECALLNAGRDGRVALTGRQGDDRLPNKERGSISQLELQDLSFGESQGPQRKRILVSMGGRQKGACWHDLKVYRSQVLALDQRAAVDARLSVMEVDLPKLQKQILRVAARLWPDGNLPGRVNARDREIINAWPKGEVPPSSKSINRAFSSPSNWDKVRQSILVE
jgi:hypothetical protein